MEYPDKPDPLDDPRKSYPDYRRDCPNCGASETIAEMTSERETLSQSDDGNVYRLDYWCSDCGTYVGGKTDWDGPVPVETYNGTELH